ncbi:proline-, glutamic acid- and leucine-rich protein 1-like [Thrips palmi]|uniref:Proline-, glutamic acid- and leucine-rich protein 1-like n=1 Tax=Thrips palmi TaxID=161013 RepID=A0A6P8XXW8_THRPL|nr:proline-, glutamic acid- and leucine-rich protein 1-like [Thrips palmi]
MNGICNLLLPVIGSENKDEALRKLLSSCNDQRAFTKCVSGISAFVGVINGKLNEPASRHDGLLLLQTFLPQCSVEVLALHGPSWITACLKGAASRGTAQLSFTVLAKLLELSETVPELNRHVSSVAVSNFAELLHQGIWPAAYVNALECLEQCMKICNGPCGPHKKVIDSFLCSLLDYSGPNHLQVFWHAARCMSLLPQTGGGGVGGAQYKLAWVAKQKQVCRTIHLILDELYSDTNELQVSMMGSMLESVEPLPLPEIDDSDPILRTQKLVTRLLAVSTCLQALLVMVYPVPKNVSISSIINLICRGLAVNGSSIGVSNTTDTLALTAELPRVHQSLLKLLEALIIVGRSNLTPFADTICKLCIQTLKWTSVEDWPYGTEKPYKFVRVQAYEVLKLWCGTAKGGSGVEDVSQQLVDVSMQDIFSEKDSVSLSAGLRKNHNPQRRSKGNKAAASLTVGGTVARNSLVRNELANKDVCVAALQAVTAAVLAGSSRIQANVHKTLQETVVTVLLKGSSTAGEYPIPFSSPFARLELYRLLLQLVLDGHTVWPAPTNLAAKLFANGLNDSDAQISIFCGMAQGVIEKIIHPAYPSLYVTPSHKEVDASIETSAQDTFTAPALAVSRLTIQDRARNNSEDSGNDLTDAVSLVPKKTEKRTSTGSSVRQTIQLENSSAESTPLVIKPVNPRLVMVQATPICSITVSSDGEDNSPSNLESSRKLTGKVKADSSVKEGHNVQKPIDLTNSDMSDDDDDISEVPCEIDLADSEDEKAGSDGEKSNVSICSQTTVNTPVNTQALERSGKSAFELKITKQSPVSKENESLDENSVCAVLNEAEVIAVSKETEVPDGSGSSAATKEAVVESSTSAVNGSLTNGISEAVPGDGSAADAVPEADSADGPSGGAKRAVEVEEVGSPTKKAKLNGGDDDEDMEFPSDEDSMLLSFVDVTRDEENEEDL